MFYDTEQNQAKLKIRCAYDGMSQSQFFRMMLAGYVEDDENIMSYVKKCKEKHGLQGQQKRNKKESKQQLLSKQCNNQEARPCNETYNSFSFLAFKRDERRLILYSQGLER